MGLDGTGAALYRGAMAHPAIVCQGLGYLIIQMNFNMDITGVFAVLVILALLGIVLNSVMVAVRRRVIFWQKDTSALG